MSDRDDALLKTPVKVSVTRRRLLRAGWVVPTAGLFSMTGWAALARTEIAPSSATEPATRPPVQPTAQPTARLWPAEEYTRLVIETPQEVPFQMTLLQEPHRLVLDMEKIELAPDLMSLPSRLGANDPYILGVRLGRRDRDVLRLVLDLKDRVDPQVFTLKPVADFGFRLVLDIYPTERFDPLLALVKEFEANDAVAALEQKYANDEELLALVREYDKRSAAAPANTGAATPSRSSGSTSSGKGATTPPTTSATGKTPAKGGKVPTPTPKPAKPRPIIVMLDPGHGGEDPGAIGRRRTFEKTVVLAIARQVKKLIDAEPNMRAVLTRDGDFFVPLNQRVEKARRVQADLMVSIHADAFTNQSARGSSVFALSERGATSAAARWLAQKENDADLVGGVNIGVKDATVAKTLLDLSQSAQINDSLRVGSLVLKELGTHNALHKDDVEQAGFAVLKAPDIPSILIETAFISNPEEEAKLRDARHQQRFAESIARGIKRYFALNPPLARL